MLTGGAPLVPIAMLLAACGDPDPTDLDDGSLVATQRSDPVLAVTDGLVSDPSVIRRGDTLYMVYSRYRLATDSITFHLSWSLDGLTWRPRSVASTAATDSTARVFSGDPGAWDGLIETPELVEIDGAPTLYYIGYPNQTFHDGIYASQIGLAASTATGFERTRSDPAVARGGPLDDDALTSPAIVEHDGGWIMLYTGWTDIERAGGFLGLTAATSPDGLQWTKTEAAVAPNVAGTAFGTATEADITRGPDGRYYLFFSAEGGIGLARAVDPLGPWEIHPELIIVPRQDWESGEVVAPTALIEQGRARIWYTGVVGAFQGASIGYAEIPFPFAW